MIILFSPSEGKRKGGTLPPLNPQSFIFPDLYSKRLEVIEQYESLIREGDDQSLCELFGIKDSKEYDRYRTTLTSVPTMKAIERYEGVAYDYLQYHELSAEAQTYIDNHTIIFSNLFGPLRASDNIPDYKLKQGASIGEFFPDKHYKAHFNAALDSLIGKDEILDLRAGYYDKFYLPAKAAVTLKFLKGGKVVSHWAKAYRGIVLREAAKGQIETFSELLALDIEGLMIHEIVETKKKKEIIYTIY
ncbi:YaaA family protein [Sulfuricurvum sp.]|uniref:YaaA family protein n=1 Tax=Sulfuricurvum sp. TaxID=2025608 RepID=UPI0019B6BF18|nr:YaaA family protein [Sulfuricurvum sp.]MBD3798505.1 YaaA family protein [Campylobacterota bacterium]MBD3805626.1 YaaA family protein [Sulfuricurvum sp.]